MTDVRRHRKPTEQQRPVAIPPAFTVTLDGPATVVHVNGKRYSTCERCSFVKVSERGRPSWWVTHRCPDGSANIIIWEWA